MLGFACSSLAVADASSSNVVVAHVGHIQIIDPYAPASESAGEIAVYLTLRNTGSQPDELVQVTSPAAPKSMVMMGSTGGSMSNMSELQVPAHGEVSLRPGVDHVMLQHPRARLAVGEKIKVTLRFVYSGTVTVAVPVIPLDQVPKAVKSKGGGMSGMAGMSGM